MKHLISNSLNEKSVINNILAGTLNKVIMLTGVYGTGKTEFAKQIARMLTCHNLTPAGYCGECEGCKSEIVNGLNSFNSDIHLLNMEKISYEEMKTIVTQAVGKYRVKNEVYIFDEFHLVDKDAQELWLAETAKLEDCYIIMTTTDKRSISDGIISRSIQIAMKQLAPLEATQLIRMNYPDATNETVQAIIRKMGGSPRELINTAIYYANAGLSAEEIQAHLTNVNQQEILLCLQSMSNRELFFDTLKVVRSMNQYTVKRALQDILWDWLGATNAVRQTMTHLSNFNEKQIIKFLNTAGVDPFITIMNMFDLITTKVPINQDVGSQSVAKEVKPTPLENIKKEEKW